ncbi:2-oxoglutarate-dependent dioxygenase 11 [Linum perenne]
MAKDEQPLANGELGGSIAVPNVQQLASESKDDHVPIRYIRPELELDQVFTDGSHQIPVIDMSKLAAVAGDDADEESANLHSACKDWGFFQVINHGVTEEVIQRMKLDLQEFFNQPLQEKMSYAQMPNNMEGFVVSEEQKLDWGDMLFIHSLPVNARNMRHWPRVPSSFRNSLEQYSSDLEKLVLTLLNYMAINLGLEPEKLLSLFNDGTQAVRMNYYPPCKESTKVMGLTPHSDPGGLTLLTQVNNDVQGLQIRKDGEWVPVVPIPSAFIVNIGDMIEIMCNGEYKSIEHRAVVNPDKERMSIALFHNPNMDVMIGPLPELTNEKKKQAKYQSLSRVEFLRLVGSSKLDGKGFLSRLMIDN